MRPSLTRLRCSAPRSFAQLVIAVAAEIVGQRQAEREVVRAPALVHGRHFETRAAIALDEVPVDALVGPVAVRATDVGLHLLDVELPAADAGQLVRDVPGRAAALARDFDELDERRIELEAMPLLLPARVVVRVHREAAQAWDLRRRGRFALRNRLAEPPEIGAREAGQRRPDQHVAVAQRFVEHGLRTLRHQRRDHLQRHVDRRVELGLGQQRLGRIDDDERHVGVHRAQHVDGHVVDDAAVDHELAVHADRREHRGHRHAGAHRERDVARAEHDGLALADVGADAAERDGQVVERFDLPRGQREAAQQQQHLLPLDQTAWQVESFDDLPIPFRCVGTDIGKGEAVVFAELEVDEVAEVLLLAPHRQVDARGVVGEHVAPRDVREHALDLVGRVAHRIEAADDRTHGRAGDVGDGDALALEHAEHADVRRAARTSAAQHEPDAARMRRLRPARGLGRLDLCGRRAGFRTEGMRRPQRRRKQQRDPAHEAIRRTERPIVECPRHGVRGAASFGRLASARRHRRGPGPRNATTGRVARRSRRHMPSSNSTRQRIRPSVGTTAASANSGQYASRCVSPQMARTVVTT
jgi:hypothetical protein